VKVEGPVDIGKDSARKLLCNSRDSCGYRAVNEIIEWNESRTVCKDPCESVESEIPS